MVSKAHENKNFKAFFLALLIKFLTRRVAMENQERENKIQQPTVMP